MTTKSKLLLDDDCFEIKLCTCMGTVLVFAITKAFVLSLQNLNDGCSIVIYCSSKQSLWMYSINPLCLTI